MREQPLHQIDRNAIVAWRIHASIYMIVLWIVVIALGVITYIMHLSYVYVLLASVIAVICTVIFVGVIPTLRYRRWRYEIFDQEIYIQHGILVVKRTIIPMVRVQHVDTEQGPILKRFRLATVTISTAATTHYIPALYMVDAEDLRDKISTLARVDDYDV